jgi:isoprenylcysteine carboxyl methyltransferase (ICMT) family protein YpbQ
MTTIQSYLKTQIFKSRSSLLKAVAVGFSSKFRSIIGIIFFLGLAVRQFLGQKDINVFFSLFIALWFVTLATLYLIREESKYRAPFSQQMVAWVGAVIPFMYSTRYENLWTIGYDLSFLMVIGSAISFWGIISLGRSFSITPSKRTLVSGGAYRLVKHPIYIGYVITEGTLAVSMPSWPNLAIFTLSSTLYLIRARWENKILYSKPIENFK